MTISKLVRMADLPPTLYRGRAAFSPAAHAVVAGTVLSVEQYGTGGASTQQGSQSNIAPCRVDHSTQHSRAQHMGHASD